MSTLFRIPFLFNQKASKFVNNVRYASQAVVKDSLIGNKQPKWMSAEEAISCIKSDDLVVLHPLLSTPRLLTDALAKHGKKNCLQNVKLFQAFTYGCEQLNTKEMNGIFRPLAFFVSPEVRECINSGRGDYLPIFLCETSRLFQRNILKPRVTLLHVSPADKDGYYSLGINVVFVRAAIENSEIIIAQVNPRMPRTFGDSLIHESCFDALVESNMEIPEVKTPEITENEMKIAKLIAHNLVENGSTLQVGIGSIPDAVLQQLTKHKDLGIHTEMISDGCVDLINSGVINNRMKKICPELSVSTLTIGTRKVYDFLDNNTSVVFKSTEFTNSEYVIAQNPKVVAINSCIEIDIVGNVNSDTIGPTVYSGFGGQVDFLRGAASALDGKGKAILTFLSTTSKGSSKIVPFLKQGSSVTTTRAHVHYVVTEYGIANLFGKNYRQRAYALINIAHPDHRQSLEKAAFDRLKCIPSPD
ncbi:acetyl-CoA hydrolase-like protein [Leptotrombidium deliense]|uniref:Acetyl-CoA hydrolase-like protein n=1 Tax=Leptotrombidium deliense TaxID=299467 RepID=A0A443S907_9ACAR|nr:acetyl-CoA hydrolase-like protein [Leptotrombidium deliense]